MNHMIKYAWHIANANGKFVNIMKVNKNKGVGGDGALKVSEILHLSRETT